MIQSEAIEEILKIVYDVLHIGVSFFDKDFHELGFIYQGREAPYCSYRRKNKTFIANCRKCDKSYFDKARKTGEIQVYRCHADLLDGIVPLFDDQGHFLGGLIYGQVRPDNVSNPHAPKTKLGRLYDDLPHMPEEKMIQIGRLLKLTTESIVNQHMVEFRNLGWAAQVQQYIKMNIHTRITLDQLADLIGKSPSFLTHHFREELGIPLSEYIKKCKMERAKELLSAGLQITQVAQRLGYYDAYHFSKAFKQYFGKPPKDFKQIVLNIDQNRS